MSEETYELVTLNPFSLKHKRIARLLATGLTPPEITQHVNLPGVTIRKVADSKEGKEAIATLRTIGASMAAAKKAQFDVLLEQAIEIFFEILENPKATPDQKLRAALAIMDRHPDGEFIRTNRKVMATEATNGMDQETINALKRAMTKISAEVIDITPSGQAPIVPQPHPTEDREPDAAQAPGRLMEVADVVQ